MRDAPALAERADDGSLSLDRFVENVCSRVRKLQNGRLRIPSEIPFTEAHNTWVFNKPSTLLVIPVGDLAQHMLKKIPILEESDRLNKQALADLRAAWDIRSNGNPKISLLGLFYHIQKCRPIV